LWLVVVVEEVVLQVEEEVEVSVHPQMTVFLLVLQQVIQLQ
jgi:hypothetical protein